MSVSTVITLGYGSFAGVKYVPTLGYSTTATPPATPKGVRLYRTYEKKKLETLTRYFDDVLPPTEQAKSKIHANNAAATAIMLRRRFYF